MPGLFQIEIRTVLIFSVFIVFVIETATTITKKTSRFSLTCPSSFSFFAQQELLCICGFEADIIFFSFLDVTLVVSIYVIFSTHKARGSNIHFSLVKCNAAVRLFSRNTVTTRQGATQSMRSKFLFHHFFEIEFFI